MDNKEQVLTELISIAAKDYGIGPNSAEGLIRAVLAKLGQPAASEAETILARFLAAHETGSPVTMEMADAARAALGGIAGAMRAYAASEADQIERSLSELVDKIVPGLDSGDLVADAKEASRHLDQRAPSEAGAVPWFECSEATPMSDIRVLVAGTMDGPHDWRVKTGFYSAETRSWHVDLASWKPIKWAHLPRPDAAPPSAPAAEPSFQALLALFYAAGNVVPTKSEAHKFTAEDGVESSVSHIINLKCRAEDWKGFLDAYATALPAPAAQPEKQAGQAPIERPDEYVYYDDWFIKDAPDVDTVSASEMARHAWLAGIRFADLFPLAAPPAPSQQAAPAAVSAEPANPDKCNADVFTHGVSMGVFGMTKQQAEAYCKAETARTGRLHDWHYVAGRVHVKALIAQPTAATADAQGNIAASVSDKSGCLSHSAGSDKQADAQGDERAAPCVVLLNELSNGGKYVSIDLEADGVLTYGIANGDTVKTGHWDIRESIFPPPELSTALARQPSAPASAARPWVGTASMYAARHKMAVTSEWMRGWNACLDAQDAALAAAKPEGDSHE